jgi:hypothetical protein
LNTNRRGFFRQGYAAAGGEVLETYVTHTPADPEALASTLGEIARLQPDIVFGLYSGRLRNAVTEELARVPESDERMEVMRTSMRTGWLNAYLSV